MTPETQERAVLDNILPQLAAEGFEIYAHPTARMLPPFMQGYLPDAIALRKDRKLAIEVLRESPASKRKLDRLRDLLSGQNEWELRVYWVSPSNIAQSLPAAPRPSIEHAIETIGELTESKHLAPALLLAWATFEALGRALLPDLMDRPQPASRLVEALAFAGHITPKEADYLRAMAETRNRLAHGSLQAKVSVRDLRRFLTVLRVLLAELPTKPRAAA